MNNIDETDKMYKIEWDDKYNIGVAEIDNAHQRLFAIIRRLFDIV